jgi:two-component system phosphate regulon response regulator OmpR
MLAVPHIVVVEDEAVQRRAVALFLRAKGFHVSELGGGAELRRLLDREAPQLVVLDVLLPDDDGCNLAGFVREQAPNTGIVLVSVASGTADRVRGLDAGADDYLAKPFAPRELLARVRSVLRRVVCGGALLPPPTVRVGRLVFDQRDGVLRSDDGGATEERLAAGDLALLRAFVANPHRPLERDWLMEVSGQREPHADDGAIDLRVAGLRRKLEHDAARPRTIQTVHGVGYMFVPDSE